jgi:hypothetical protein
MATTYSTNDEIRKAYPGIDDRLWHTRTSAAHSGSIAVLSVLDTVGAPMNGTVYAINNSYAQITLPYVKKISNKFILSASVTLAAVIASGAEVFLGDAQLDGWRVDGKAYVDENITNPDFPVTGKARVEKAYVFYMACQQSPDAQTREWGSQVLTSVLSSLAATLKLYPPVMRQTIVKLVEENLTDEEIEDYKYGVDGDQ